MKNFRILLPIFFLVLFAFPAARFIPTNASVQEQPLLVAPSRQDFEIKIRTIGALDAARSHMISSELPGDKGKIILLVDDGQKVQAGDILVKMDPSPFDRELKKLQSEKIGLQSAVEAATQLLEWEKNQIEREIRTAEYNLQIARLDLKKLVEGDGPLQTSHFREELDKTEEEYNRNLAYISDLKDLHQKGFQNPSEIKMAEKKAQDLGEQLETARKKYQSYTQHVFPALRETAKARVEKAKMELDQIKKGSAFRVAKAISSLKETQEKLQIIAESIHQAEKNVELTTIRAPFSGIAILYETFRDGQKRKPRVGDRVLQNQPLLYLPDVSSMIVQTRIREIDLHRAAVGQRCVVEIDAFPELALPGEVAFIGVMASRRPAEQAGEKFFRANVAVKGEDARLRPGMTARTTIHVAHVQDAMTIPIEALFVEEETRYCFLFSGEKFKKIHVEIGRQNEHVVEIRSGLEKNSLVSLVQPRPDQILP
jgi:HlyD family secretion protein